MTSYRGLPACTCLAAWLPVFEAAIGREVTWWQLAGDAKASAGFHRGGGSADCPTLTEKELRIARNMGAAAWNRWWSGNEHAHIRLNGCPHNTIAQPQVADLNEGRDGTGPLYDNAGTPDNGPRDRVHWPLRTWREGIAWADRQRAKDDDLMAFSDWNDTEKAAFRDFIQQAVRTTKIPTIADDGSRVEENLASVLRNVKADIDAIRKG